MFRLPLFFEAEFIFGPCLVLLVAVFRGPVVALFTSLIATIPLYLAWGSPWAHIIFGMEAVFVGLVCQYKRLNIIMLVMCFWVVIGMPVSWYSISKYEFFIDSHRNSILIKQLTNGILYAHITALLVYLPAVRKRFVITPSAFSIKQQSSHIIASLLITVGIIFFFFNLNQNINNASERFNSEHNNKHKQLSFQLQLVLSRKIEAFKEYKQQLIHTWKKEAIRKKSLLEFHQRHPEFNTMIMVNKRGQVINSSPPELIENVLRQNESISVSDRDYFQQAMVLENVYVSPAFMGRGFGKDLIAAFSVGIPQATNPSEKVGVVEGTFVLESLHPIKSAINALSPALSGVLVDQNNQVLFSSNDLNLKLTSPLNFSESEVDYYEHSLFSISDDESTTEKQNYFKTESSLPMGWKLITLQDEILFAAVIEKTLIVFAVSIVALVLIAKLLAWLISYSWSYSFQRLNQMIMMGKEFDDQLAKYEDQNRLPLEVNNLYKEVQSSRLEILKMNQELQNTVAERTEKLQTANARLYDMARQDSLTQLNNRRMFVEQLDQLWLACKNDLVSMSMIILDIDHFKKVNDSYGHPVGDEVLSQVAGQLNQFNRPEVKCLARIGGEEFCLLIKAMGHNQVIEMAEEIRSSIAASEIKIGSEKSINITVSLGVATIDPTKFTPTKLYQLADNILYDAKRSGRNTVKSVILD